MSLEVTYFVLLLSQLESSPLSLCSFSILKGRSGSEERKFCYCLKLYRWHIANYLGMGRWVKLNDVGIGIVVSRSETPGVVAFNTTLLKQFF